MLVLTRHATERVLIDTGREVIVVRVERAQPGKVRLGFESPHHVKVWREEIAPAELRAAAEGGAA